jgi:nicotinate-nucleotide adenylyltransferase
LHKLVKKLGIFGGTFNPIHMGHLIVAEMARQECDLEKVLFIPAASPPHKSDKSVSCPNHRFRMTELAIESNPYFKASDIELKREGKSYTIDTLKNLREIYPKEYEFWMIIGGDSLIEFDNWRNAKGIMELCNFAVYMRPYISIDKCMAQADKIRGQANSRVIFVQAPMIDISSTDIRRRVVQGKSIRYMVPDPVREYILEKRLFIN